MRTDRHVAINKRIFATSFECSNSREERVTASEMQSQTIVYANKTRSLQDIVTSKQLLLCLSLI
jgi:hypothetical protein